MNDDAVLLELEKIRREYDVKHVEQVREYRLMQEKFNNEHIRFTVKLENLEQKLEQIFLVQQDLKKISAHALTPLRIRDWIVGLAGLIGAILFVLSILSNYSRLEIVRSDDRKRVEQSVGNLQKK